MNNICWTAAQETAHALGLDHEYVFADGTSACSDPMKFFAPVSAVAQGTADFRVGGRFRFPTQKGQIHGEFQEIIPGKKIVFSWLSGCEQDFDRPTTVTLVLDDEEASYNQYSYGKYLGYTPLSDTDEANIDEGKESVLDRTRRLFYVCCSRAVKDLAVVLFATDVAAARAAVVEARLFPDVSLHGVEQLG